jgi:cobalt-zinc-cadmium efflux system membrane fusion protein
MNAAKPSPAPGPADHGGPSAPSVRAVARGRFLSWLLRAIPTLIVLVVLGGLALLGHQTGWTFPRFGDLIGKDRSAGDDWCKEHSVPESICVECNESLMPRSQGLWCDRHGVFDCPYENPAVAQLSTKPRIEAADLERARRALSTRERPENSKKCQLHDRRIQFASAEAVDRMGVDIDIVQRAEMEDTVSAPGVITYAQPLVAPLSIPVAGRIWKITEKGRIGATVKEGDVLALVDSLEVGKAKVEFQQALGQFEFKFKDVELLRTLSNTGVSKADLLKAEAELREAQIQLLSTQQALRNLGLPVRLEDVKQLSPVQLAEWMQFVGLPADLAAEEMRRKTTTANLIPVTVPRDCGGVLTSVDAAVGKRVDPSKPLFEVVDNSRMWLTLHVRLEDKKYLRIRDEATGEPGQTVRFRPDGSDQDVSGELNWISTAVDEKSRTIQVQATLSNAAAQRQSQLKANTFGTGTIILRREPAAIVVPNEAVHWEGDCYVVFVRDRNYQQKDGLKVFHVRTIRPGAKNAQYTEVIAGVLPGEVIACRNSAALRSELLKNQLGEG